MGKRIIFSLGLLLSLPTIAQVLPFIDRDFKTFVNNRVAGQYREQFAHYFGTIDARIHEKGETACLKFRADLRQTALDAMKHEHHAWEKDIATFLTGVHFLDKEFDQERESVRNFLYWYGALDKFTKSTKHEPIRVAKSERKKFVDSTKAFFDTMKVKLSQTTAKIGDWFKNLKTKLT